MIAIIFEVWPSSPEDKSTYLELAAALRAQVSQIEGFISIERFQSLTDPDKLLSLSFFRDDAAVAEWRRVHVHREAQAVGRTGLFRDYRIRVAHVIRDYGLSERAEAPDDSRARHG